jgi:ribosomal protein L24E
MNCDYCGKIVDTTLNGLKVESANGSMIILENAGISNVKIKSQEMAFCSPKCFELAPEKYNQFYTPGNLPLIDYKPSLVKNENLGTMANY